MTRNLLFLLAFTLIATACGSSVTDKGKGGPSSPDAGGGDGGSATCGDGTLDPGEACDPGIVDGAGACPQSCQAPACSTATLIGTASDCTARCEVNPVACSDGDGCCSAGCDINNDSDCTNLCGDGVVEGPEVCDGNCPTSCQDGGDACSAGVLRGSPNTCDATCGTAQIIACNDGDGCCPSACTADNDSDCGNTTAACGDGVTNGNETCDGNCPTSCDDRNACTNDQLLGSAAACTAICQSTQIDACIHGDGCCPSNCDFSNDNDCACQRRTCAQVGAQCGSIDDGCGGQVQCSQCPQGQTCSQNTCLPDNAQPQIGDPCTDFDQCTPSQDAACIIDSAWTEGYCTEFCMSDSDCPSGAHCGRLDLANDTICLKNCASDADCRPDYVCENWDDFDANLPFSKECAPVPSTPGNSDVGEPCITDNDCAGPAVCLTTLNSGSGAGITFPGGYCSTTCTPVIGTCGTGEVCTLLTYCAAGCTTDFDCRIGYSCIADAFTMQNHCWPSD